MDMVINKKTSKTYKLFLLKPVAKVFVWILFARTTFVRTFFVTSIILLHGITESWTVLRNY